MAASWRHGNIVILWCRGRLICQSQASGRNATGVSQRTTAVAFSLFRNLREAFASGDFFFVHAGVKPDVDLAHETENDLLWIRHEFLSSSRDFGKIIIHGHTPTTEIELRSNRINIDTGAFATGRLTCLVIEGETLSLIDTVPN